MFGSQRTLWLTRKTAAMTRLTWVFRTSLTLLASLSVLLIKYHIISYGFKGKKQKSKLSCITITRYDKIIIIIMIGQAHLLLGVWRRCFIS